MIKNTILSFSSNFFATLICVTAISYLVSVLEELLSLEPAANEFETKKNENRAERSKFLII